MDRKYGVFTVFTPLQLSGDQGGKMMNIEFLVVIMADSASETWYQLTNIAPGHHAVLHRTEFHAIFAEISKM